MSGGEGTQWRFTDFTDSTDRWHLVCRLLADPIGESMCLVALLERLPGERHRHRIVDDCARRQWGRA